MSDEPAQSDASGRGPVLEVSAILMYPLVAVLFAILIYLAGPVEVAARLRILDFLADIDVVQVTDAGSGIIVVGINVYEFARKPIRYDVAFFALVLVFGSLLVRGFRYSLIADNAGVDDSVTSIANTYYFGFGMNFLLPFGPGEYASVQALTDNGADPDAAVTTVYYTRLFEALALTTGVFIGLVGLGWNGALEPILITVAFLVVLTAILRPFGTGPADSTPNRSGIRGFLDWLNLTDVAHDLRRYFGQNPSHALRVFVVSVIAIYLEVTGFWFLKEAFSTPLFQLLGDITYVQFGLVVAAASFARVVPITPGGLGVTEGLLVVLFHFGFEEGYLSPVVVGIIDATLFGLVTMALFAYARYHQDISVRNTWRSYMGYSRDRLTGERVKQPGTIVESDAD